MKLNVARLTPLLLSSLLILLVGCEPQDSPHKAASQTSPEEQHLYLRYFTSGESFYNEIRLEQDTLYHTQFEDTENRCAQWVKSTPCWTEEDLKTTSMVLSGEDIDNLYAVIDESGILDIQETHLGGAQKGQRHYAQHLEIHVAETEKHFIYQSFPGSLPKPEAFQRMETMLLEYARGIPP